MTATPTSPFPVLTLDNAPAASKPALQKLQASVGMIPNLAAAMASSPALITAFVQTRAALETQGSFSAAEREVVSLANAVENGCDYCTAIHATFGLKAGLAPAVIDRLRARGTPEDRRLAALARTARQLLLTRGNLPADETAAFFAAGYTPAHLLELVARLALSVMANYSGHITSVAPDEAIRPQYRCA